MIVLDASAAVEWLLGVEVAAAMRGLVLGGRATPDRGRVALTDFVAADIAVHDSTALLPRVWELRSDLTAYDATYVALAETLGATLFTTDARLGRAPGHEAEVVVLDA